MSIPTTGSSLDRALHELCPPGVDLQRFPSTVDVMRGGKLIGSIPVPYDPQSWQWWKDQILAITDPQRPPYSPADSPPGARR